MSVDALIDRVIAREGGYVNHSKDRGGPTKYGITQGTLSAFRGYNVSAATVEKLTKGEAGVIYRANYYFAPHIDSLPGGIAEQVFDIGVNSGPTRAIRMLQEALVILGSEIVVDGKIGPNTRRAAGSHPAIYVNNVLVFLRNAFFRDIVTSRPDQREFISGWLVRSGQFRKIVG